MTTFRFLTLASLINIIFTLVNLQTSSSFSPIPKTWASYHQKRSHLVQQLSKEPLEDMFGIANSDLKNDATQYFVQGSPEDELSDEMWEDIRTGEPPQWLVLKEVSGLMCHVFLLSVYLDLLYAILSHHTYVSFRFLESTALLTSWQC
jgi:uncharacterized protein YjiS (DUF1127 family)